MGSLPFHETTIRMPAQQFLCRFSKGPLWFCVDSPLTSLFAGLGESRNESDVLRPDFKSGRRRTTLVFSFDPAVVAGMRKKTLTHHHRPRAERAFTPLVSGKKVAVEIERIQINGDMSNGLCAVDDDQTLPCPGQGGHFMDREDTPVNVRHVAHHDGFDARLAESFLQRMQERLQGT